MMVNLLLLSIFIVRLPPFSLPFGDLTSHGFFRIINGILFLVLLLKNNQTIRKKENTSLIILIFLFFLSQALSVFGAKNFSIFFGDFEKLSETFVFFFLIYFFFKEKGQQIIKKIIVIFIATSLSNLLIQLTIFLWPNFIIPILEKYIHLGVYDIIFYNLQRQRLFFETLEEALVPIFLYLIFTRKDKRNFFYLFSGLILVVGTIFISFVSNFRVRFLVSMLGLVGYFLFVNPFKGAKIKTAIILILIGGTIFFAYRSLIGQQGFTVVERLLLEDKNEDVNTIGFRIGMVVQAYDIGIKSPIFGVGLGNFYDNLPLFGKKDIYTISPLKIKDNLSLLQHPHNSLAQVFVESGLFGLLTLLLLLGCFIKEDVKILFGKQNNLEKTLIISFWSLFAYSLFTPPQILVYYVHFWLLRVLIEKTHNQNVLI